MPDRWVNPQGWETQQPDQEQAPPQPGWGQPPAQEEPTQPGWGSPPAGPPEGWGSPPQRPEKEPSGEGVRSFLRRHPLAFFGGILLILGLIGVVLGDPDNSPDTARQAATADPSTHTPPTVARTEASTSTAPPTTVVKVTVPNLVGMRAGTAKNALAERGLRASISYKITTRYPSGSVISQSREDGGDVRRGSTVTLVIAKAPPVTSPPSTEPAPPTSDCDPAYPNDCLPSPPPDLDCADIRHRVEVDHQYGDPHRLDADGDGIGCDSWG